MFGPRQSFGVPDYLKNANDQTMTVVLIEDIKAVNNLDEILDVDHIDVYHIAPSDLAQSMGHIGDDGTHRSPADDRRVDLEDNRCWKNCWNYPLAHTMSQGSEIKG